MKEENNFYLIFALTQVVIRLFIYVFEPLKPESIIPFLHTYHIHHFWLGIILIIVSLFIKKEKIRIPFFAVSLAFFSDELIYMIAGGNTLVDYWQPYSIMGAVAMALVIYFFRKKIYHLIKKI